MFCFKCGAELEDGALFCAQCGTKAETEEKTAVSPAGLPLMFGDDEPTVVMDRDSQPVNGESTEQADYDKTIAAPMAFAQPQAEASFNGPAPSAQQPQTAYNPEPAPKPKKKKTALIIILVVVAVMLAFIIGAVVLLVAFGDDIKALVEKSLSGNSISAEEDEDKYGYVDEYEEATTYVFDSFDNPVTLPEEETYPAWVLTDPTVVPTLPPETTPPTAAPTRPPVTERVTQLPVTRPPEVPNNGGLNSSDPSAVASFYEAAVNRTYNPSCYQNLSLNGEIGGDGAIGTILAVLQPTLEQVLAENSYYTSHIPGSGVAPLYGSDISSASAISNGSTTTVTIYLKGQVDGPDADGSYGGPVARGIGTLGSIDDALAELGAEITSGRDTISLSYRNAYIKCVIDNSTGEIISGTWYWTADIFIGSATASLGGISANLKNLSASINYKVTM